MDRQTEHEFNDRVRQHWDELAPNWNIKVQANLVPNMTWEEWTFPLRNFLPPPDPAIQVLDAGCGVGQATFRLAQFGYEVKACDFSPKMLEFARQRVESLKLTRPVEFTEASVEQLPYLDTEFDVINCFAVLDFTPKPVHALRELRHVSKPGGRLLLAMLGANSPVKYERWKRLLHGLDPEANKIPNIFNGILPWEVEKILPVIGWQLIHHEANYGPSAAGTTNEFNAEELQGQPILFQQTAATMWLMVADAVEPQPLEATP